MPKNKIKYKPQKQNQKITKISIKNLKKNLKNKFHN